MRITVAYLTNRREPMIQWFLDSLARELPDSALVVVDFFQRERPLPIPSDSIHVAPKPTVWQGPHRLTKTDYFAAANARNTALCFADSDWIVYCDDLSVLMPGWGAAVREAVDGNYIACGAYRKVCNLKVESGNVVGFVSHPNGFDSRVAATRGEKIVPASGSWLFGCSCAMSVESLLSVNGWDENCDGCGSEDYCTGIRLGNAGYQFKYDQRMMTYESEELHFAEPPFRRIDKGNSPHDKSHSLLHAAQASKWCPNYFGEGGIRRLRERILSGEPFPISQIPDRDFFDGQPLCEM